MSKKFHVKPISAPILGFCGVNGAGKTVLAVENAIGYLRQGMPVFSTVPIESEYGSSEPIRSLTHLVGLENCHVLLDEVASIFSSRNTSRMPAEVVTFLQTLRHKNVSVAWTAPVWTRADIVLRQVTQAVVIVRPLLSRPVKDSLWRRTTLTGFGILDCTMVSTDEEPDKVLKRGLRILKRSPAFGAYDTHAETPQIGRLLISGGACPDCGGQRPTVRCSPQLHDELGISSSANAEAQAGGPALDGLPQRSAGDDGASLDIL